MCHLSGIVKECSRFMYVYEGCILIPSNVVMWLGYGKERAINMTYSWTLWLHQSDDKPSQDTHEWVYIWTHMKILVHQHACNTVTTKTPFAHRYNNLYSTKYMCTRLSPQIKTTTYIQIPEQRYCGYVESKPIAYARTYCTIMFLMGLTNLLHKWNSTWSQSEYHRRYPGMLHWRHKTFCIDKTQNH